MPVYLLAYEPRKESVGTPWALEDATGERRYFARVVIATPAATIIIPGTPRPHAYLKCEGDLMAEGDTATVRPTCECPGDKCKTTKDK